MGFAAGRVHEEPKAKAPYLDAVARTALRYHHKQNTGVLHYVQDDPF